MANREQKSKVSFSVYKPKTIAFARYEKEKTLVGLFLGRATGRFERTDDRSSETYVGIKGAFKAVIGTDKQTKPEDIGAMLGTDDENSVASGIAYMPDAWLHPILDALDAAKAAGAVAPSVEFAYAVYLGRRGEQDYEWIVEDLRPVEHVDPLAAIVASSPRLQIAQEPAKDAPKGKAA